MLVNNECLGRLENAAELIVHTEGEVCKFWTFFDLKRDLQFKKKFIL